ncbi:hypothetical protein PAA26_03455 [Methanomassiliicoccaceae archaeon COG_1]|nr:hypothetical protein [Methanomassiliicoccaceae archaeon COG_1]
MDMTSTIAVGLPPMAAMSFTFTSTAKYPAMNGSDFTRDSMMPSVAKRMYFSPSSITAASSPLDATTWGKESAGRRSTTSRMADFRVTPG